MDKITLKGIHLQTLIGWHAWERNALRPITVDLVMGIVGACTSDNLADTIDYEQVVNHLRADLLNQHFLLIETLAEYIAQQILDHFATPWVKVTVIKPGVLADVDCVSVEIERSRHASPV